LLFLFSLILHTLANGPRRGGKFSVQGKGEDGVQAVSGGLKKERYHGTIYSVIHTRTMH